MKTRNPCLFVKYKVYRNKLNHLINVSKNNFIRIILLIINQTLKNIWKGIKELVTLN